MYQSTDLFSDIQLTLFSHMEFESGKLISCDVMFDILKCLLVGGK